MEPPGNGKRRKRNGPATPARNARADEPSIFSNPLRERSTGIATVLLDAELRVRNFTPTAAELLQLIEADVGRPITELASGQQHLDWFEDARAVLARTVAIEREVEKNDGRWYMRRILPYRTPDDRVAGVITTLTDVTTLKRATETARRRERQQATVVGLGQLALAGDDLQGLFDSAVRGIVAELGVDYGTVLELLPDGKTLFMRAGIGWNPGHVGKFKTQAGAESQSGYTLQSRGPIVVENLLEEPRFRGLPLLHEHNIQSGITVVIGAPERPWGVLGVHSRRVRGFSPDDVHFVQAVANLLAESVRRHAAEKDLRNRAHEMDLLFRATTSAAVDLEQALQECIDSVCEATGWPIGHAFIADRKKGRMVSFRGWHVDDPVRTERLRKHSEDHTVGWGDGFVGGIWKSGQPMWVRNVTRDASFMRAGMEDLGVRGAFGFPVRVADETVAVLEFFSYDEISADEHPLRVVRSLGEQVGRVVERNRAERASRESAERLALALEAGQMGAWDWDMIANTMQWSAEQYRILGYKVGRDEPSYEHWADPIHPDDLVVASVWRDAMNEKRPYRCQYRIMRPDGDIRWVEARGQFLYDNNHEPIRMYGVMIDVTDRRKAEEALREADQRKDQFLATLGHELRNPLAAITSGVHVLRAGAADAKARERVHGIMLRQVERMASLLNDLLDMNRVLRGVIELRPQKLRLRTIMDRAVDTCRTAIEARAHELTVHVEPEDLTVWADPVRLEQVLVNLISNAATYTEPRGKIRAEARREGDEIQIHVHDTGIGLTQNQIEHVFKPFHQCRKGSSGLGIGLHLVEQLCQLHGGRVRARSAGLGRGSTFSVALPVVERPAADPKVVPPLEAESLRNLRVLLVEDHDDAREALTCLLSHHCEVQSAPDGARAIELASRMKPHVVLLDLGLPGMDGFEVAERLREKPELAGSVLIALSGFGDEETSQQIKEAGFAQGLVKPVSSDALLRILARERKRLTDDPAV